MESDTGVEPTEAAPEATQCTYAQVVLSQREEGFVVYALFLEERHVLWTLDGLKEPLQRGLMIGVCVTTSKRRVGKAECRGRRLDRG